MRWTYFRPVPWIDTRARFVAHTPRSGTLLDIGSSDGETLRHMNELRPDLRLLATDVQGSPELYPHGAEFHRGNVECQRLPWPDASVDAITCMHLVEHLTAPLLLFDETARLLKPGGCVYLETPHPRSMFFSSPSGSAAGTFTANFFDDLTHVKVVTTGALAQWCRRVGLVVEASGTARNLLFAAAYPLLLLGPKGRKRFTARNHFVGWSAYLIARKP